MLTLFISSAELATTVDIQPLIIELNETILSAIMDFFTSDIPASSSSTKTTNDNLIVPSNAIPPPPSRPSKTKVISENLEIILSTGSLESKKTIVLGARQLFFASQPFKAGLFEGI